MTKKKLRDSFNTVINAAEKLKCEDVHHKKEHQHNADEVCPVIYEIYKHCNILREHMKEIGIQPVAGLRPKKSGG